MLPLKTDWLVTILFLAEAIGYQLGTKPYHNYHQMKRFLFELHVRNPSKTNLYSIGRTVQNRDILVFSIAGSRPEIHLPGRPEVKLVAGIHGDEAVGRELLLYIAEYLVQAERTDLQISQLLESTRIHILPMLNPDGAEIAEEGACAYSAGRENANHVDINRNFPDFFHQNWEPREPETIAIMNWIRDIPFIFSISFHGGARVVNYPFDGNANNLMEYSTAPDDDVFQFLAQTYAKQNPLLYYKASCEDTKDFLHGITNGANWYPVIGGMQDYNYVYGNCLEITVELDCCKFPPASDLPAQWNRNQQAILDSLIATKQGVRGFITDSDGHPVKTRLNVKGRSVGFNSTSLGEYWRILLPGRYDLVISTTHGIL